MTSFHLSHDYTVSKMAGSSPIQAQVLRNIVGAPSNPPTLHADAWGLKKLFTYGVRKSGADKLASGSPQRRVPWLLIAGSGGENRTLKG